MKKRTLTLILFILFVNVCFSQSSVWKIVGNGNTSYIAGSIHILRAEDYPLPPEFESAFNASEVIVFETDIQKLEDPTIGQKLMAKSMFADDQTLQSVLSDSVYKKLEKQCASLSLPLDNFSKFKPSMVAIIISMTKMQQMGMSSEGVDKYFHDKSIKESKELSFLETVDEQIDLLTTISDGIEDEFVLYSLEDIDNMEKELLELISSWRNGKSNYMIDQIKETEEKFPSLYQSMLVDRNYNWIPKIEKFLDDEKVELIIVGSLHLHGKNGILKQLANKGFEVTQLKE